MFSIFFFISDGISRRIYINNKENICLDFNLRKNISSNMGWVSLEKKKTHSARGDRVQIRGQKNQLKEGRERGFNGRREADSSGEGAKEIDGFDGHLVPLPCQQSRILHLHQLEGLPPDPFLFNDPFDSQFCILF